MGFGAAGKDIIAANMKEGDLEVLMPGKMVTCVFGFGIIEDFTETVGALEEKICSYINSIAMVRCVVGARATRAGCCCCCLLLPTPASRTLPSGPQWGANWCGCSGDADKTR